MTEITPAEQNLTAAGMLPAGDDDKWLEADLIIMGRPPAARFDEPGTVVSGIVIDTFTMQQKKFGTDELDWWDDGRPKMQAAVVLRTPLGPETLYIGGRNIRQAVSDAIREARAPGLRPGGTLAVRYTGDDTPRTKGARGAKMYEAAYEPPGRKPTGVQDEQPALLAEAAASEAPPF